MFNHKPYIAVIGDMKNSKKLRNRQVIQEKLKGVLEQINIKYKDDLSSKFIITLGDEFQGLLYRGGQTLHIICEIERKMYPVKIRFGIGIGEITTKINQEMSIGADGPGYYKAREAIEYLKKNEKMKKVGKSDIRVEADMDNQTSVITLNTIFTLLSAIKDTWSDRQREVIWDMLEHQDSQMEAAGRLNIQQPTVQRLLSKGKYFAYREALDAAEKVLGEIKQDGI